MVAACPLEKSSHLVSSSSIFRTPNILAKGPGPKNHSPGCRPSGRKSSTSTARHVTSRRAILARGHIAPFRNSIHHLSMALIQPQSRAHVQRSMLGSLKGSLRLTHALPRRPHGQPGLSTHILKARRVGACSFSAAAAAAAVSRLGYRPVRHSCLLCCGPARVPSSFLQMKPAPWAHRISCSYSVRAFVVSSSFSSSILLLFVISPSFSCPTLACVLLLLVTDHALS